MRMKDLLPRFIVLCHLGDDVFGAARKSMDDPADGLPDEVFQLIEELMDAGKRQLTVLLLGKSGVGKSSTVNSFLKMQVARVSAFKLQADTEIVAPFLRQADTEIVAPCLRQVGWRAMDADDSVELIANVVEMEGHDADGFRVKLIDTCGLEDPEAGDTINMTALKKIASEIKGEPIDVVLYVDRLDLYRVDALDKGIIGAISDTLGKSIWKKTVLVLTHGNLAQTPPGTDYADRAPNVGKVEVRSRKDRVGGKDEYRGVSERLNLTDRARGYLVDRVFSYPTASGVGRCKVSYEGHTRKKHL
eukprot:gene30488-35505_t